MRRYAFTRVPVSLALLFAGSLVQAGDVISSVDKDGNVTFSDHVPVNAVTSKEVRVETIQPSQEGMAATLETTRQLNEEAEKTREQIENMRKTRQEQAEKRRGRIEAQRQLSRGEAVEPLQERGGVVIDGEEFGPEYRQYLEQLHEAEYGSGEGSNEYRESAE
ncbi:MAG: DUF4124 domain-containing protein [Pseudomonadota bacterium]